jgi:hypothetical protein
VSERRKTLRRGLHLPVVVKGHGREGPWEETTNTMDVCHGGAALMLSRRVPMGTVLHLSLPLPEMFRRYDSTATSYRIWALVRNGDPHGPPYRTGAMFLGKHPPRGYEQNPAGLFFLPSDPQPAHAVQRSEPRYPLLITIRLRRMEEQCEGAPEELTITEDVSLGGARVRTTLPVARGELVSVAELDGPFRASALVQNVSAGDDRIVRLNLQFMNEAEAATAVKELLRRQGITVT